MADAQDYLAVDAIVHLWTAAAMAHRPGWTDAFFVDKMGGKHGSDGISLDAMLAGMDRAGTELGLLAAPKAGRLGLPGSFHMPVAVVADAVAARAGRCLGLAGIDPYQGMAGVRELERAVRELGFVGAHLYPHWFELAPNHAKRYPFYAKCVELGAPVQIQVGSPWCTPKSSPAAVSADRSAWTTSPATFPN